MTYFILEVDQAYVPPRPVYGYGGLNPQALGRKKHDKLSQHMVFQIEQRVQTVWTDVIIHPCFMVSKGAKEVLEYYEPSLRFVRVILSNKEKARSEPYYIPSLEGVAALTANSQFGGNRSVIHHAEVDGSLLRDRTIVRITNINQAHCILIRLDLAESLLTNNTIGIGLKETTLKPMNKSERSRL
ncbi:MAG: hypothetical protein FWG67_05710 [Defluviitaleaceae bacterium]|nr:hypothetical protein [Defluviitaleaceae bacterium]